MHICLDRQVFPGVYPGGGLQLLVDQEDLDSAQEVVNRFMAKAEELQYDPKEPKFNKNYERVMRMLGDV